VFALQSSPISAVKEGGFSNEVTLWEELGPLQRCSIGLCGVRQRSKDQAEAELRSKPGGRSTEGQRAQQARWTPRNGDELWEEEDEKERQLGMGQWTQRRAGDEGGETGASGQQCGCGMCIIGRFSKNPGCQYWGDVMRHRDWRKVANGRGGEWKVMKRA
jgi:hypothetical protein